MDIGTIKINTADSVRQMKELGKVIDAYSAAMLRAEKMTDELVQSNERLSVNIEKVKNSLKSYAVAQQAVIANYQKEATLKRSVNKQYQDEISGLNRMRASLQQYNRARGADRRVAQTSSTSASKLQAEQRAIQSITASLNQQAVATKKVVVAEKELSSASSRTVSRLKAQAAALTKTGIASNAAYEHSKRFIGYWTRFAVTQTIHRAIYGLISALHEAINTTIEFEQRISEVRTISQDNQLDFSSWVEGIKEVSNAYGTDLMKTTEAVYQTLSNQIAKGSEAVLFTKSAAKFGVTAVTDTNTAVQLLSSALNSYKKSALDAEEVSASLFKTIELGRLRASDIANDYGNVAVESEKLGIKMNELNASLATLTIHGIKPSTAMTQLRGVMLKLIKPTTAMKDLMKQWGYDTAEALIKAEGFPSLLSHINEEMKKAESMKAGGGTELLGNLFGRVRGIIGALGMLGNNLDEYDQNLAKFSNANEDYFKAQGIMFESMGMKMKIQLNELKNYFVEDLGRDAIGLVGVLTNKFGSLTEITKKLITATGQAVQIYLAYKLAVVAVNMEMKKSSLITLLTLKARQKEIVALQATEAELLKYGLTVEATAVKEKRLAIETEVAAAKMKRASIVATTAWTLGLYAVIAAITETISVSTYMANELAKVTESTKEYKKALTDAGYAAIKAFKGAAKAITETHDKLVRELLASRKAYDEAANANSEALKKKVLNDAKVLSDYLDNAASVFKKNITSLNSIIKDFQNRLKGSQKLTTNFVTDKANLSYYDKIVDSIGKVDKAWIEASKKLAIYQSLAKRGWNARATGIEDIDNYNKQLAAQLRYREAIFKMAKKAYQSGNVSQGRELITKLIGRTDALTQSGFKYSTILKARNQILATQLMLENQVNVETNKKIKAAEQVKQKYEDALKIIQEGKEDLGKLSLDKNIDESEITNAYKRIMQKVKTALGGVMNPQMQAQINLLLEDKNAAEKTKAIIKSLNDLNSSVTSNEGIGKVIDNSLVHINDYLKQIAEQKEKTADVQTLNVESKAKERDYTKAVDAEAANKRMIIQLANQLIAAQDKAIPASSWKADRRSDVYERILAGQQVSDKEFTQTRINIQKEAARWISALGKNSMFTSKWVSQERITKSEELLKMQKLFYTLLKKRQESTVLGAKTKETEKALSDTEEAIKKLTQALKDATKRTSTGSGGSSTSSGAGTMSASSSDGGSGGSGNGGGISILATPTETRVTNNDSDPITVKVANYKQFAQENAKIAVMKPKTAASRLIDSLLKKKPTIGKPDLFHFGNVDKNGPLSTGLRDEKLLGKDKADLWKDFGKYYGNRNISVRGYHEQWTPPITNPTGWDPSRHPIYEGLGYRRPTPITNNGYYRPPNYAGPDTIPVTPTINVNVDIDGKEVTKHVTDNIERGSARNENNVQTKNKNKRVKR